MRKSSAAVAAPESDTTITLSLRDLELFGYHCSILHRETGNVGMSCREGLPAVHVRIEETDFSRRAGKVWDSCTMNGQWVGNRCGAVAAYAKYVAGVAEWWRHDS